MTVGAGIGVDEVVEVEVVVGLLARLYEQGKVGRDDD